MFGIVQNVDVVNRRCVIEISDASGRRMIRDVLIGEAMPGSSCTPSNGQYVEIGVSDSGWKITNYYVQETDRANRERLASDPGIGDSMFGGAGGAKVGVLEGAIALALADETTGIVASKGITNILGKTMAFLNSLYQKTIVDSDIKLRIREVLSGPLAISPRREKVIDTLEMEESTKYNGFKKISIKVDGDPLSLIPAIGTQIECEMTSINLQKVTFKINGATGDIEITSGLARVIMKASTGEILFNTEGLPTEGIVTFETKCQATGLPHCGASQRVKAALI
jgi:hypothetical protein